MDHTASPAASDTRVGPDRQVLIGSLLLPNCVFFPFLLETLFHTAVLLVCRCDVTFSLGLRRFVVITQASLYSSPAVFASSAKILLELILISQPMV